MSLPVDFPPPLTPSGAQPAASADELPKGEAGAARDFAALVLSFLVREMFESTDLGEGGPFGAGPGAEVYRGFAVSALADALAGSDALAPLERLVAGSIGPSDPRPTEGPER